MTVSTTPPWPQKLIPHEFSCQPKTKILPTKFNTRTVSSSKITHNTHDIQVTCVGPSIAIAIGPCKNFKKFYRSSVILSVKYY